MLAGQMESPVRIEVSGRGQGAQLQDGLGPGDAPAGAAAVEAVADDMAARPFDDAGGDGEAFGKGVPVAQVRTALLQVAGTLVHGRAHGEASKSRAAPHAEEAPCA